MHMLHFNATIACRVSDPHKSILATPTYSMSGSSGGSTELQQCPMYEKYVCAVRCEIVRGKGTFFLLTSPWAKNIITFDLNNLKIWFVHFSKQNMFAPTSIWEYLDTQTADAPSSLWYANFPTLASEQYTSRCRSSFCPCRRCPTATDDRPTTECSPPECRCPWDPKREGPAWEKHKHKIFLEGSTARFYMSQLPVRII